MITAVHRLSATDSELEYKTLLAGPRQPTAAAAAAGASSSVPRKRATKSFFCVLCDYCCRLSTTNSQLTRIQKIACWTNADHKHSGSSRYIGASGASISISRKRTDQNTAACYSSACCFLELQSQHNRPTPKYKTFTRLEKTAMSPRRATNAANQHRSSR